MIYQNNLRVEVNFDEDTCGTRAMPELDSEESNKRFDQGFNQGLGKPGFSPTSEK